MRKIFLILAVTAVLGLTAGGCSRSRPVQKDLLTNAHKITIGQTTAQDAELIFGKPASIKKSNDGTARYIWTDGRGRGGQALIIDFDKYGFASDYTTSSTKL